jgi:hypothetical protein
MEEPRNDGTLVGAKTTLSSADDGIVAQQAQQS